MTEPFTAPEQAGRVDALIAMMVAHGIAPTPPHIFAIATEAGVSDDDAMLVLEAFEERLVGRASQNVAHDGRV